MSPAEWDLVRKELSTPWGCAVLLCDGFKLTVEVRRVSPLRFTMVVFVNGVWKGMWSNPKNPCDEQTRFARRTERPIHKAKDLEQMKKVFGKKQLAEMKAVKFVWFHCDWPSFEPLRRHLVKHNKVIQLVHPGPPAAVVDAVQLALGLDRSAA